MWIKVAQYTYEPKKIQSRQHPSSAIPKSAAFQVG
jgi:hypothetical protein